MLDEGTGVPEATSLLRPTMHTHCFVGVLPCFRLFDATFSGEFRETVIFVTNTMTLTNCSFLFRLKC